MNGNWRTTFNFRDGHAHVLDYEDYQLMPMHNSPQAGEFIREVYLGRNDITDRQLAPKLGVSSSTLNRDLQNTSGYRDSIMGPWLFLFLAVFGAMTLSGCDQLDDEQGQVASQPAPVAQPHLPKAPGVEELAPGEETVTWLDDTGDVNAKEIDWDALIPADWRPETLMGDVDIENLSDDDPRAQQLLDKLKALWSQAPVVPALEGQQVKLPGFVVPLEMDAKKIDQFLLVPYYGACIHVPPPPANQTVHVVTREGKAFAGQLFDVVWVTGTMRVERLSSDLAEAGYRLEDASVVPYE